MDDVDPIHALLQLALVTGVIGGGTAWMAGRAIAQTWRPFWHVLAYAILLGIAVRFVHFAVFGGNLLAAEPYFAETIYLMLVSALAWRMTRAAQMATQYHWLFERTGPFTWRAKPGDENSAASGTMPR